MSDEKKGEASVYINTYGCQMNVLDSELVQGQFEAAGYKIVDRVEEAGVVLLNTCSVRDLSEQKVWSQLGRLALVKQNDNPDLIIGVLGCMAEREGTAITRRMRHVDVLCGPSNLDTLPLLVDNALRNRGLAARRPEVALSGHNSRRTATREAALMG